jgi:hypothetical protein
MVAVRKCDSGILPEVYMKHGFFDTSYPISTTACKSRDLLLLLAATSLFKGGTTIPMSPIALNLEL